MNSLKDLGPLLLVCGLALAVVGLWLTTGERPDSSANGGSIETGDDSIGPEDPARRSLFGWFGHLPGDIRYESSRTRVYFPITSMLLVSAVLTLLFQLRRLF